jgi:hypothetical protein
LIRFSEIGSPILPTPMKPMVSISTPFFSLPRHAMSSDWSEKFTFTPNEPSISVHSRTSKLRSLLTTNGSADAMRRASSALRGAQDGQAIAGRRTGCGGERPGGEQHALLFQPDHVFEMLRQHCADLFGRRVAFGENHIELLSQHPLRELPDPVLSRRCHDAQPANPLPTGGPLADPGEAYAACGNGQRSRLRIGTGRAAANHRRFNAKVPRRGAGH